MLNKPPADYFMNSEIHVSEIDEDSSMFADLDTSQMSLTIKINKPALNLSMDEDASTDVN